MSRDILVRSIHICFESSQFLRFKQRILPKERVSREVYFLISLLLLFNTASSYLICEKAIVFMYYKIVHSVCFSTWKLFNHNIFFSHLQHTTSNIHIGGILYYTAVLYFSYPVVNVRSFSPGHAILQEKNSAFSLYHASIVRSLICEKTIVFVYSKIVYTLYFYQLRNS